MKDLKVDKRTIIDWIGTALTTENQDEKKVAYNFLSYYGIKSKKDCLDYLKNKSKEILKSKKEIFDKTTNPNVEMLFKKYCEVKNQTFTDANSMKEAIKDALIGNSPQEDMDYRKMHSYLLASAEKWRKRVISGLNEKMPLLEKNADYDKVKDFYDYLQTLDFNIPYNFEMPFKGILSMNDLEEKFAEVNKLSIFTNLNLPYSLQSGIGEYIHLKSTNKNKNGVDFRLYMNIKSNNRVQLMSMLKEECEKIGISFHGKICGWNKNRNDNFVIYTNYVEVNKILEILDRAKNQCSELFEGAENLAPIWGRLEDNDYIGVGDEPLPLLEGKSQSYSSIREKIFEEYFSEYGQSFDYEKMKDICRSYGVSIDNFSFTMQTFANCVTEDRYNKNIKNIDKLYRRSVDINVEMMDKTKSRLEKILSDEEIINEINKHNIVYLSGQLIGEVYRYAIIHQSQDTIKRQDLIDYIQKIRQLHLDTYGEKFKEKSEEEKKQYIEDGRSKIIGKSIAEKLEIDSSNIKSLEDISPEDQSKIKEYFIKNYVDNGYVFHSFPYARKESVEKDGFTRVESLWDNEKVNEIVKIFEEKGVIKALGGYGFYDKEAKENLNSERKIYVEHNPEAIFFHELSAPEWFKIFTSSAHSLTSEEIKTMPFFLKNYDACKQNVADLCENAGLTLKETEKVSSLFEECWKTLGKPELTTALIPRKKVGKDNISEEIKDMNFIEAISYISTDGARDFIEHVGNVVDAEDIEAKDISVVEMPPADRYFTCENFTRETKEVLYDPAKNIASIYKGVVLSDGTKIITQDQYNKIFNKIESLFPDKKDDITTIWKGFYDAIKVSPLNEEMRGKVETDFKAMEENRKSLKVEIPSDNQFADDRRTFEEMMKTETSSSSIDDEKAIFEEMMKDEQSSNIYTDESKSFIDMMEQVESEEKNIDAINESSRKAFTEMMEDEPKTEYSKERKGFEEIMEEVPKQDYSEDRKIFEDIISGKYKPEHTDIKPSDTVRTNENLPYGGKPQQQNKQESHNEMTMGM